MYNVIRDNCMEKEKLLDAFREKLGEQPDAEGNYAKSGISQRTLDAYVDAILPSAGETPDDAFYNTHIGILNAMGGQIRHEKAAFAKSYQPQKPAGQEPAKQEPAQTAGVNDGNALEAIMKSIKELSDMNKTLAQRLDTQEREKSHEETVARLNDTLKGKYLNFNADVFNIAVKESDIDGDRSLDDKLKDVTSSYEAWVKKLYGDGPKPRTGQQQRQSEVSAQLLQLKEKHIKEGKLPQVTTT